MPKFNFNRKKFGYGSNPILARDFFRVQANVDIPNIAAGGQQTNTVAAPGAQVGDIVHIGYLATPPVSLFAQAWVSAVDEITVRHTNLTAGALNPAAQDFVFIVQKKF